MEQNTLYIWYSGAGTINNLTTVISPTATFCTSSAFSPLKSVVLFNRRIWPLGCATRECYKESCRPARGENTISILLSLISLLYLDLLLEGNAFHENSLDKLYS
jgi:hypothetical protein